jgi:Zn-dependent M28 family amino/carboxypeptidase
MASGAKPKRTIRFILWSGEEQGLLGSRAYVEKHKDELPKISAVLNDDGGSGYQGGYVGIESMKSVMEAAFAPTAAAFPQLPMKFVVQPQMPVSGSSDHAPFIWAGVPAFFTMEEGPKADYGKVWHTQFDRYEESVPEYLIQSSTNHAVVAYHLANAPELLARFPKPERRQTMNIDHALAVGADHMYEEIELHLSGKEHDHNDDYVLEFVDRMRRASRFIGQFRFR